MASQTARLERALETGDHYAALQLYRTVIKRKIDGKSFDEASDLLVAGSQTLLRSGKAAEALDLADMLLKALLIAHARPLTEDVVGAVVSICREVPPTAAALGLRFAKAAIRWATKDAPLDPSPCTSTEPGTDALASVKASPPSQNQTPVNPVALRHQSRVAQLHAAAARLAMSGGPECYPDAQRHFLEADAPEEFADFLVTWAGSGYRTERDLFLARGVLQLLCLGNLRAANIVRERFLSRQTSDKGAPDSPLSNFLRFLLLTLERDARPLFEMLLTKYASSLARDPSFKEYVQSIGHRFYSIPVPQSGMAAMMGNLMGMFGGGNAAGGRGNAVGGGARPTLAGPGASASSTTPRLAGGSTR